VSGNGDAVRVQLLGPVRAWRGADELALGGPRRRAVFGMLAMRANQPVARSELIDGLWGDEPPSSAVNSVHVYVAGLRRVLEPRRENRAPGQVLPATGAGYLLRLDPAQLDTAELDQQLAAGRRQPWAGLAEGDLETAARSLDAALRLWQGIPLAGIPGPWADTERVRLGELRLAAIEQRIELLLGLGRHRHVVAQLTGLIREHPLRERFREQLMLALYRCGRQADALAEFAAARRVLGTELGIEPGPGLRHLQQRILAADTTLDRPAGPAGGTAERGGTATAGEPPGSPPAAAPGPAAASPPVPRELPADVAAFTGREGELAELDARLARWAPPPGDPAGSAGVVPIAVVTGTAGVGKTALAVHWAHRARDRFPGGQLYVNLRGFDPAEPMAVADALAGFLRALGLASQHVPADVDERAARYRSLLDGRRVLILLDNAAAADQVRLLLPGTPSCFVLVTSRDSLTGLVARHGARRLDLDPMPPGDAIGLLRVLIGGRVDADPTAAGTLAGQCARLPLALRVAAEFAVSHPALTLAELTGELAAEQRRLDLLDAGGDPRTAVRAVLSWSYRQLPPRAARAFRLAGLHPAAELSTGAAAALFGSSIADAADLLGQLRRAHLVHLAGPGRYGLHDLLRAYAADLAAAPGDPDRLADGPDERRPALARVLDYYLGAAAAAMDVLFPAERHRRPRPGRPAPLAPELDGPGAARAWLDTERDALQSVAGYAAACGWPAQAIGLSATLSRYLETGGHYAAAVTLHTQARRAAQLTGDRSAEAHALNSLGIVTGRLGGYQPGADFLGQSLAIFRELGEHSGAARALGNLGSGEWRQGRYAEAERYHRQSLALFRAIGDELGEARALNSLGLVSLRLGRCARAASHFRDSLALYSRLGDQSNEAHALGNLGLAYLQLGRHQQAGAHLQRARALSRGIGCRTGEASALTDLGTLACRRGRYPDAASYHRQALALFRAIGERVGAAEALNGLGEVLLAMGHASQARDQHATALELAIEVGDPHEQARARHGLAAAAETA
jgi:DNA-binding SARP family transcriptional activator/tetratricopeptide (TPR) repeat protein